MVATDITRASAAATMPMPQAIWTAARSLLEWAIRSPGVWRSKNGASILSRCEKIRLRSASSSRREKPMIR